MRPADESDADAIARLLVRCELAYLGASSATPETALGRLGQSGSDPRVDSTVVCRDTRVVGFAHVWLEGEDEAKCFARVDPDCTGEGIGTRLLASCERRAAEGLADGGALSVTNWAKDTAGPVLLEGRGYRLIKHFLQMGMELHGELGSPRWPDGVQVDTYRQGTDDSELFEAACEAFAGAWEYRSGTGEADWWRERRDDPGMTFDPALWFVARDGGRIAGFCLCYPEALRDPDSGYIAEIGVRPGWQGRGLGQALLLHGLRELKTRGRARASLNVDAENVSGATRLYEKVGMTPRPLFTVWELEL